MHRSRSVVSELNYRGTCCNVNVMEEYQVKVLHTIYLCPIKGGRGAGAVSLILQRKRMSSLSRDTEIKYCFKWKVFRVRQRHIEASFMNIFKILFWRLKSLQTTKHDFKNGWATEIPGKKIYCVLSCCKLFQPKVICQNIVYYYLGLYISWVLRSS